MIVFDVLACRVQWRKMTEIELVPLVEARETFRTVHAILYKYNLTT